MEKCAPVGKIEDNRIISAYEEALTHFEKENIGKKSLK